MSKYRTHKSSDAGKRETLRRRQIRALKYGV